MREALKKSQFIVFRKTFHKYNCKNEKQNIKYYFKRFPRTFLLNQ